MVEALAPLAREARTHVVANADGAAKQAMPTNASEVGEIKKKEKRKETGIQSFLVSRAPTITENLSMIQL